MLGRNCAKLNCRKLFGYSRPVSMICTDACAFACWGHERRMRNTSCRELWGNVSPDRWAVNIMQMRYARGTLSRELKIRSTKACVYDGRLLGRGGMGGSRPCKGGSPKIRARRRVLEEAFSFTYFEI